MPCALALPTAHFTVLLAVVMHFLCQSTAHCFADAAVIRNYRDNHTYSQNLLCQTDAILNQSEPNVILTAHATKVNRTEPN